jgi:molecular chaperone DnaK
VYTIGAVIEEQPLLKSIGLGKADNSVDWYFKAGSGLPQKKRWATPYKTTVALKAGQPGDVVRIPVVEGEQERANRNREIGALELDSSMVRRDLPQGSDVEVTLRISESRTLTLEAYFPLLDDEKTIQLKVEKSEANPAEIIKTLSTEKARLEALKDKAGDAGETDLVEELEKLEDDRERDDAAIAAKVDPAAAEKAQARVLELQLKLDAAEERLKWPALVCEARDLQEKLKDLAEEHGTSAHRDKVNTWSALVDSVISKKQTDHLQKRINDGQDLYGQILVSLPGFWVGQFQTMERERHKFLDVDAAERQLQMGRAYMKENNVEGLSDVVRKLWSLLPKDEAERAQYDSGSIVSSITQ